jgi:hypothetical protein
MKGYRNKINPDTKSRQNAPHCTHHRKLEVKKRKFGVLADKVFSFPCMKVGVVHFLT